MKKSLRSLPALSLLGLLLALPARAEDTRPPAISDVGASKSGTKVTVKAKITDETGVLQAQVMWRAQGGGSFDAVAMTGANDKFTATFEGKGGTIEYFVQAIDELGNGPSKSPQSTLVISGKAAAPDKVASNDAPPRKHHGRRRHKKTEEAPAEGSGDAAAAADSGGGSAEAGSGEATAAAEAPSGPPTVEHTVPTDAVEGQDLVMKVKVTNSATQALAWFRKAGEKGFTTKIPLEKKDGDDYELTVPSAVAKGTVEYVFIATNSVGKVTQGDGGPSKPYSLTFGKGGAASGATASSDQASGGAFVFAHKPLTHAAPGAGISIRVQATPPTEADAPTKAMLLTRDATGNDQQIDLAPDETGGIGGFAGQLPAAKDGALYYQVVACNKDKCAVDTGNKKSWHAVAVSNDGDAKAPEPIDAVSSKAPANLPE